MTQTADIINFERPVVKADIENGFTRIANELTEALMKNTIGLSGREYQIINAIIAKTYRYHKAMDWISSSQLAELTGIDVSNVGKVKSSLIKKNVLIKDGQKIGINTTVSSWIRLEKSQIRLTEDKSIPTRKKSNPTSAKSNPTHKQVKSDPHNKKDYNTKDYNNKKKGFSPSEITLPSFLPKQLWLEFIQHRKDIKKPMSELACTKLINQLTKDKAKGLDVIDAMNESIVSGWSGVFPKPTKGSRSAPAPENFSQTDYGKIEGSF